jgi:hypothetical protein
MECGLMEKVSDEELKEILDRNKLLRSENNEDRMFV